MLTRYGRLKSFMDFQRKAEHGPVLFVGDRAFLFLLGPLKNKKAGQERDKTPETQKGATAI